MMEHKHDEYCGCPSWEVVMHQAGENIKKFGWHAVGVGSGADSLAEPTFIYTVGLRETFDHPELVVSGLPMQTAHSLISSAISILQENPLEAGELLEGIVMGWPVRIDEVDSDYLRNFSVARDYYQDDHVAFLQIIWPDSEGIMPGSDEVNEVVDKVQILPAR